MNFTPHLLAQTATASSSKFASAALVLFCAMCLIAPEGQAQTQAAAQPASATTAGAKSAAISANAQQASRKFVKPLKPFKPQKANTASGKPAKGQSQQGLATQFARADVDKAGRITKKQAFNAKMYDVDRYFFDMDTNIDGYVTLEELTRWKANPVRTSPRPRGDQYDRYVDGDAPRAAARAAKAKAAKTQAAMAKPQ